METNSLIDFSNTKKVLLDYAEELQHMYTSSLIGNDHFATGGLIQAVKYNVVVDNRVISIEMQLAKYWKWVEEGRKPGKFPPIDKILKWIQDKPVRPKPNEKGKLPSPKPLAFLIARKIANEGTKGTHDLHDSNKILWKKFQEQIDVALSKDLEGYVAKFIITSF